MSDDRFPTARRQDGKPGVRTWRLVQNTNTPVEGELKDWPASLQDPVFHAFDHLRAKHKLPLMIVHSEAGVDTDTGPFVLVVVQYIPNVLVLQ